MSCCKCEKTASRSRVFGAKLHSQGSRPPGKAGALPLGLMIALSGPGRSSAMICTRSMHVLYVRVAKSPGVASCLRHSGPDASRGIHFVRGAMASGNPHPCLPSSFNWCHWPLHPAIPPRFSSCSDCWVLCCPSAATTHVHATSLTIAYFTHAHEPLVPVDLSLGASRGWPGFLVSHASS